MNSAMATARLAITFLLIGLGFSTWLFGQNPGPSKDKVAGTTADHAMVERLIAARKEYQETLEALRTLYISTGDIQRARWAEEELMQYHRINKQAFRLALDVPPPNLQALHNIPQANELYRQAMTFKDKGWGTDYIDNQHRAELLLQQLLTKHPQSDKISDTAYQLGDIYESRAYRQLERSAEYFKRCYQWNPKTQYDARLRAARLFERLNQTSQAMEIYKEITVREVDPRRYEEAQRRLQALSGAK